jgi:adenylate kinase
MIRNHNLEVKKTGQGVFWDERVTDNDESVCIYNVICFIIHLLMSFFLS